MHGAGLELILIFLLAAVIAVPVFSRLGLGAVLGYLIAGVALGPDGLKVIRDAEPVLAASEIGVVMLLFVIGLELSPARLRVMRKPVFGAGGLQVGLSAAALGGAGAGAGHGLADGAGDRPRPGAVVHRDRAAIAGRAQGADQRTWPPRVRDPAVPGPGRDPAAGGDPVARRRAGTRRLSWPAMLPGDRRDRRGRARRAVAVAARVRHGRAPADAGGVHRHRLAGGARRGAG